MSDDQLSRCYRISNERDSAEILYVEDNAADARLMVEVLKEMNAQANLTVLTDGLEAVQYLYRQGYYETATRPDLILLDMHLPGKNGNEVLAEIKKDKELRRVPVIMLSSSKPELDNVRDKESSAEHYVAKSPDLSQFMETVQAVVDACLQQDLSGAAKSDEAPIRVLLVEDNPGDARLIREALADIKNGAVELEHADRFLKGVERLNLGGIDVMLLDLTLPDSSYADTFVRIRDYASQIPIVVLTGLDDETVAVKAVQEGAQDYLIKGQVDGNSLMRSIRYAIERHRMQHSLREMSLKDELTGLYNRRGFLELAQHQLKICGRTEKGLFILFADLDNLKGINDAFGHVEGDYAIAETAAVLKETFRDSDIVGRLGGDEFAVLAVETEQAGAATLKARLKQRIEDHNRHSGKKYGLSISVGIVHYNPDKPCSIEELLRQADILMYEEKRRKTG